MASFANMTLADWGATNRTFEARLNDGRSQVWRYPVDGNVVNDRILTLKTTIPQQQDGVYKEEVIVEIPLVDAPAVGSGYTPPPKRIGVTQAKLFLALPARATLADRQNAIAFLRAALANTQITDAATLFSPPRG